MSLLRRPDSDFDLEEALRRLEPRLRAVVARFHVPPEDAEDLLQQSLLALLYKEHTVHDVEAWLLGTLRNRCLMYWRGRRRRVYDAVDSSILEAIAEPQAPRQAHDDLARDLESAIARLPDRCRSVLHLRYRMGFEPPEAAVQLGYSPSSIYKITERCLAALTRQLVASGMLDDGAEG